MTESSEGRSLAEAMKWASRASSIALQFAVPAGGGAWLDRRFDSSPWLLLLGLTFGSYLGFRELLRLARSSDQP